MPDKSTTLAICAIVTAVFVGCEKTDSVPDSASAQPTAPSVEVADVTSSSATETAGSDTSATTQATEQPAPEETNAGDTDGTATGSASTEDTPYTIVDGKVDNNTYIGWQKFRTSNCGQCHGGSGDGGSASLVDRLTRISKEEFTTAVLEGKGLMPPWKTNKTVVNNLDNIYAYLKARSDGVLPEGKPQRIEQ